MKYMVSNLDKPNNSPIYSIQSSLDSFILYNSDEISQQKRENKAEISLTEQSELSSTQVQNNSKLGQQENENKMETPVSYTH